MQPVRIKYYGLIWITRRGYLTSLAAGGVLAGGFLVFSAAKGSLPPLRSLWEPVVQQGPGIYVIIINNLYRFLILCLLLLAIEAIVVLRKFAKKEAEQRAQEAALQATAEEKPSEAIMEKQTGIIDSKKP